MASLGRIDEVIGRDDEIERLLDVLARRRSNNPILVGPPGVGKTAIVEGLARRLAQGGEGVRGLEGTILVELSAGGLVSGTGVRGALSERMRRLQFEVKRAERQDRALHRRGAHPVHGGETRRTISRMSSRLRWPGASSLASARPPTPSTASTSNETPLSRGVSHRFTSPSRPPRTRSRFCAASRRATRFTTASRTSRRPWSPRSSSRCGTCPSRHFPTKRSVFSIWRGAYASAGWSRRRSRSDRAGGRGERCACRSSGSLVTDSQKLLELEQHLAEHVVGHADVMTRVSDALRKGAAGFHGHRPLATFSVPRPDRCGQDRDRAGA